MMYRKPADMKYTDLAIWVDKNAYADVCNFDKMYKYIYCLVDMLARKRRFFKDRIEHKEFVQYATTRVFLRMIKSREQDSENKLPKIKSVLNYLKKVLHFIKIDYGKSMYDKVPEEIDMTTFVDMRLRADIVNSVDALLKTEFDVYLDDVVKTIRKFLSKIPYKKDGVEWENIYLSCLLSFLNSITLSNRNKCKLSALMAKLRLDTESIEKLYKRERYNSTILFHLDNSMKDYIKVLVNRIRHIIADSLSSIVYSNLLSEESAKNLLFQSLSGDLEEGEKDYES